MPIPENVRLYLSSSTSHGFGTVGLLTPPPGQSPLCQNPTSSAFVPEATRALLVAMDEWADRGIDPPKSNYPTLQGKTLVALDKAREAFPEIPGVNLPIVLNEYELLDFGPDFGRLGGLLALQPPRLGPGYTMFVPTADKDGLNVAGIRPMQIRVPLGTSTGWNVRASRSRNATRTTRGS